MKHDHESALEQTGRKGAEGATTAHRYARHSLRRFRRVRRRFGDKLNSIIEELNETFAA